MSSVALSDTFEYLCYGPWAVGNILIISVRDVFIQQNLISTDVYIRQILTYKDGPRAERINRV